MANLHRIEIKLTRASGGRVGWMKKVNRVDTDKRDGYAFIGEFVREGWHDFETGTVLVEQYPNGSVKHGYKSGAAYVVTDEGALKQIAEVDEWHGPEFMSFRDKVAQEILVQKAVVLDQHSHNIKQVIDLMTSLGVTFDDLREAEYVRINAGLIENERENWRNATDEPDPVV